MTEIENQAIHARKEFWRSVKWFEIIVFIISLCAWILLSLKSWWQGIVVAVIIEMFSNTVCVSSSLEFSKTDKDSNKGCDDIINIICDNLRVVPSDEHNAKEFIQYKLASRYFFYSITTIAIMLFIVIPFVIFVCNK